MKKSHIDSGKEFDFGRTNLPLSITEQFAYFAKNIELHFVDYIARYMVI